MRRLSPSNAFRRVCKRWIISNWDCGCGWGCGSSWRGTEGGGDRLGECLGRSSCSGCASLAGRRPGRARGRLSTTATYRGCIYGEHEAKTFERVDGGGERERGTSGASDVLSRPRRVDYVTHFTLQTPFASPANFLSHPSQCCHSSEVYAS